MGSPWDDNSRKTENNDLFNGGRGNELLGQILERSTSAPPLPSEINAPLGGQRRYEEDAETYLFGTGRQRSRLSLFDDTGRDTAPVPDTSGYIFAGYDQAAGTSTAPSLYNASAFDEPLFGTRSRGSLIDDTDHHDDETSLFVPQLMPRSHSAAPTLRETKSLGPPPGYGMRSNANEGHSMDLGLQRSASTGVIGGRQQKTSSSVLRSLGLDSEGADLGAVRPAPKTLMDLIQEDFPSSPSPMFNPEQQEESYPSRPRTASPPTHYYRIDNGRYEMEQQKRINQMDNGRFAMEHQERAMYSQRDAVGNVTQSMDRVRVDPRESYAPQQRGQQNAHYAFPPQRSDSMGREYAHDFRIQRPVYAPTADLNPHVHLPPQQTGQYYQNQPVYYSDGRQPRNVAPVQAQILPSGHTVYVNAPTYGYSTPQYLPATVPQHQQQQRIIHHAPQTMQASNLAPQDQYISVLPVHGGSPGQMAQVASSGGYAYWQQPDVSSPNAQMMSPTAVYASIPTSMPRAQTDSPVSDTRRQKGVRTSPNEKSGSTRRGGRGRRGGTEKHPTGGTTASPLLEEFRASKSRDWSIIDIKGHVVEFCQDQNGSRFIQQRLEVGDLKEKQIVINEVLPEIQYLRNDVFGNYVVQKLLEFGTPEMRADIRETLKGEMLALSLQMYGCRVVQKALEMVDEDDLPRLLLEFHHNVLSCIQDQNGNHVIQKCVEVTSSNSKNAHAAGDEAKAQYFSEQIDFIIDDVLANTASLSCHPYGCRVLQRILEHCVEPKKTRTLDEISKCHRQLLDDQYGNYVIQHVLQYGRHSDRESILEIVIEGGLLSLAKQKFASNVVEKLLKYGSPGQRNAIVSELLKEVDEHTGAPVETGGTSVVLLMVRDAYANYVVQTALDVVPEGEEKRLLLAELTSHSAQLRNYTFAKHIVTKLGA